jgi:RNA polymerase sigma-54 factor
MLDQKLQQRLLQKLSPQQIQLIKLLEIPTLELEQRIKKEMEENPALEEGSEDDDMPESSDELEMESDEDPEKDSDADNDETEEGLLEENEFTMEDYLAEEEDDTPYYNLNANNFSKDDDKKEFIFSAGSSFHESLVSQLGLRFLTPRQFQLAEYMIGNIEDDGYLRREIQSIVDDLAFLQNIQTTDEELETVLHIVQQLDPPGIAARSLKECLLLQLERKPHRSPAIECAIFMLNHFFDEFTRKHYDKIMKKMELSEKMLKEAVDEIIHLNPRPGNTYSDPQTKNAYQIIPDFMVDEGDGKFFVSLNSRNSPELKISSTYSDMVEKMQSSPKINKREKEAMSFVKQKVEAARWFIDALEQRQQTLMLTMNAIINYQKDFFREGEDVLLRPMILKDISDVTGLDISTVSRVANSKYVQTRHGIYPLKFFFSESMQNEMGEEVSTREIKKILQDEVDKEDKRNPLTDEELAEVLKQRGYPIARRTIAKYREQLNLPVGRLRKEL